MGLVPVHSRTKAEPRPDLVYLYAWISPNGPKWLNLTPGTYIEMHAESPRRRCVCNQAQVLTGPAMLSVYLLYKHINIVFNITYLKQYIYIYISFL